METETKHVFHVKQNRKRHSISGYGRVPWKWSIEPLFPFCLGPPSGSLSNPHAGHVLGPP